MDAKTRWVPRKLWIMTCEKFIFFAQSQARLVNHNDRVHFYSVDISPIRSQSRDGRSYHLCTIAALRSLSTRRVVTSLSFRAIRFQLSDPAKKAPSTPVSGRTFYVYWNLIALTVYDVKGPEPSRKTRTLSLPRHGGRVHFDVESTHLGRL